MFKKVLIANRGEIACRVIHACSEMGIKTVSVHSDADKNSLHAMISDDTVNIGPAPAGDSYLSIDKIIKAAKNTNCDAIHPGYGFLSENSEFNSGVRKAGLVFIGPDPEPVRILGSKTESRKMMMEAGIPVIPGMKGSSLNPVDFAKAAEEIGYPVLIKASAGGGGKGMRIVLNSDKLQESVEAAIRESKSAFGSDEVFLEKYLESPRHVEIQILADNFGNVVYLFERECSIQRRHQKIIEEAPSPALNPQLRKSMGETAVKVAQAANYNNAGTVEFLLDKHDNFYFLEVNTRIQVEHPVTEEITGLNLVKLQLEIASGAKLPFKQEELSFKGHAFECRIYAEDPDSNFMPSSGTVHYLKEPVGKGVRYDSGIFSGAEVPMYYDPIMAKLVVWGRNREEARRRMLRALRDNVVLGVKTSIGFMSNVLRHPEFISGNTPTDFIEKYRDELFKRDEKKLDLALKAASLKAGKKREFVPDTAKQSNPWQEIGAWEVLVKK